MEINDKLLDELQQKAQASERRRAAMDLRNDANEQSQRMLNALEPGTIVPIHRHPTTSETCLLLRGRLDEIFYDDNGKETARHHFNTANGVYGLQIPAGQWHTIEVYEPSVILEVKAGSYEPSHPEDIK